ncbi:hypothetical protein ACQKP0_13960 [Heyndrickxia sp. NPDC080065]|uniref:hypothetical protein n=1 Tax=Heyndrickxia sp. NPDC080065 TaxID=3390568 RepID=UPI003CFFEF98
MKSKLKILNAVKFVAGTVLAIGTIIVVFGFLKNDYHVITPIGIGTVMGAVFIFLMGIFFVATEEMLEKIDHREEMVPAIKNSLISKQ